MTSRTPAGAVSEYVDLIQLAVSCVSDSVVTVRGGYYPSDTPHSLQLNEGTPVRLGGTSRLWLSFHQFYRVSESEIPRAGWTVVESGYRYRIMNAERREILSYHWHPGGRSPIAFHHLHIGNGAMVGREELQTAHLPTGYVSAGDIIAMLIRDFSVSPRRPDWESILVISSS